jgi:PAS domain-containing protein
MTPAESNHQTLEKKRAIDWLVILGPALLSLLATAAIIGLGKHSGWPLGQILGTALLATLIGTLAATALLYAQVKGRQVGQQSLSDLEIRVSNILESAMDPVITVDNSQRIILFNKAAEKVFRWPRQAVVGQHMNLLLP